MGHESKCYESVYTTHSSSLCRTDSRSPSLEGAGVEEEMVEVNYAWPAKPLTCL